MPPEPPDETPVPPPPPAVAEGGNCPRCGTPYEPYQEYCLECGLRLPARMGVVAVLAHQWQRRLPWYPGDWIWPVLLGLVIAALAATGAILATRDDDSPTRTQVATGPPTEPQDTVPSDTAITVTLADTVSTETNKVGDSFTAHLSQPIVSCPNCGNALAADARFCPSCGAAAPEEPRAGNGTPADESQGEGEAERPSDSWER